jgi:thymidylate synthase
VTQPSSIGSGFGHRARGFRELTATSFVITSPRRRLTLSAHRPIDLGYALANVLWVMCGSDSLEPIQFYNPNAAQFSDDGVSLFGAPGARIFQSIAGDQFEQAARRLQGDPSSRRAVIETYLPDDLFAETRDCCCLTHMQFLVRDGALTCIANMRSQSVLMVMPYDLVLLTMLHEAMAARLGVRLGQYVHCCGSFHYYTDEEKLVRSVVAERLPAPPEMPVMQAAGPDVRQKLGLAEKHLRTSLTTNPSAQVDFDDFGLDVYWHGYLAAVAAGVRRRKGLAPITHKAVPETYLPVLEAR